MSSKTPGRPFPSAGARRADLAAAAVLGVRAPSHLFSPDKHGDCESPVSSASHLRLQHHSRQIGFGAHPRHGKIPARPLHGAGRGQIPRCQPHPISSHPVPSRRAALYEAAQPPALSWPVSRRIVLLVPQQLPGRGACRPEDSVCAGGAGSRGQRRASLTSRPRAGPDRTGRGSTAALGDLHLLSAQPSHLTRSRGSFVEPTAPCLRRPPLPVPALTGPSARPR